MAGIFLPRLLFKLKIMVKLRNAKRQRSSAIILLCAVGTVILLLNFVVESSDSDAKLFINVFMFFVAVLGISGYADAQDTIRKEEQRHG